MRQGTRQTSARYQAITDEEMLNEGERDEVWPSRPASNARRYRTDVRAETGRSADVQSGPRTARHMVPPRRTAAQERLPPLSQGPSRALSGSERVRSRQTDDYHEVRGSDGRRFHWFVFVGLALLVMLLGWVAFSAIGAWFQTTQDDWHYGRPRTFQIDQVVGHHDSAQNPSHFIAMNLNRHIIIIEMPGGDFSKSVVFSGPTLVGPGQDLTPVTLTFQDVNHDGKLDMLVNIQGNQLVYLNENGTFVSPGQNPNPGG